MEKLQISISPEQWGQLVTKYTAHAPRVKDTDFTEGTINLDTDTNGALTKRKGGVNYNQTLLAAAPKDQYEAIFSDGARHLLVVANGEIKYSSGDTIFNTVVNGTGFNAGANFEFATTQDRVYGGNKINPSIVYDRSTAYGGVTYTAPRIKNMGCQIPSAAPVAGAPTAGGSVPDGAHRYKVTFVYYDGEESNGCTAVSATQTCGGGNNTIPLTVIPTGGYGVTQRGIYRDNNDGNFTLITYIADNTTVTYNDTLAVGVTPTPIPTNNGTPPLFGLISLWLDRLWLSQVPGDPYTLFYSEVSQPDIYGSENQILCNQEDPITATVVYFDRLVVFNRRSLGQIVGSTPDTFRYAAIPSSVGCVDNRTLQTHVLNGVPVLLWLSEKGFYTYDGNAIDYISDPIEDLINYNIRQATQQKNSNSQTSFSSGTPSNGIDATQLASSITTRGYLDGTSTPGSNPKRVFDDTAEWESGTQKTNLALLHGDNKIKAVTKHTSDLTAGTVSGAMIKSGGVLKLTTGSNFIGETLGAGVAYQSQSGTFSGSQTFAFAYPIIAPLNGTLTELTFPFWLLSLASSVVVSYQHMVYYDAGNQPGTAYYTGPVQTLTTSGNVAQSTGTPHTLSKGLTGGQKYWIGVNVITPNVKISPKLLNTNGGSPKRYLSLSGWLDMFYGTSTFNPPADANLLSYDVLQTAISASGTWESAIYDTFSNRLNLTSLTTAFTNLTTWGTKTTNFIVQASTDGVVFNQIYSSPSLTGVSGQSIVLTGQRYIKFFLNMSTTDNRETNSLNSAFVTFPNNVEWISDSIDTTSDVTAYNSFTPVVSTPSGTSVTVTVATSANSAGPWGGSGNADGQFGPFGSVIVRQWVRIKAVLTKPVDDLTTPSISSFELKWTIVSNFVAPVIDTGVAPPAGWDVFLAQYALNNGTVQFQMRSGSTNDAAPGTGVLQATFQNVTPTEFPALVTPLQFTQWKVILTSSDNAVPVVESVTVQWFIGVAVSVRPASIFVDGRYYVSLAELEQTTNNLLLQLDLNSKWRRHAGPGISTFSFFFNRPYYGLATSGQIRKFLEGNNDAGTPIELDVRTKAFDYSTSYKDVSDKFKVVGDIIVSLKNTGAAIQFQYSVDNGTTFYPLYDLNGNTSYQTTDDETDLYVRFKPSWTNGNPIAGQEIMYRIYSNDLFTVEVYSMKMTALVRKQPPVITG